MSNMHHVVPVAIPHSQYALLLNIAEHRGLRSVDELVRDLIARTIAAGTSSPDDPVVRLVLDGFDDGAIARELELTRQNVARRRRGAGLKPNTPYFNHRRTA